MKKETKRKLIDALDELETDDDREEAVSIAKREKVLKQKHNGNGW